MVELRELKILRENYASFCSMINDVDHLLPYFVQKGVISIDELEEIRSIPTNRHKVTALFKNVMHQLKSQNTTGFYDILRIMKMHGLLPTQDLASKIYKLLREQNVPSDEGNGKPNNCSYMDVLIYGTVQLQGNVGQVVHILTLSFC